MNRADAFAHDMCNVLHGHFGLEWTRESKATADHECVDVIGKKNGKIRVLVEVELRRIAPLGNVAKVWKRANQGIYGRNVIMFQAFSAFYAKNGNQRKNAEFVGKQMQEACGVKYFPLSMKYKPAKRHAGKPVMLGAGRRRFHAQKLARSILSRLRRFL